MARPLLEVADIFRQHGAAFRATHPLSPEQRRVMCAIEECRTSALGGHVEALICDLKNLAGESLMRQIILLSAVANGFAAPDPRAERG